MNMKPNPNLLNEMAADLMNMEREYPDPAERYEDLHREEREFEKNFDAYLHTEEGC